MVSRLSQNLTSDVFLGSVSEVLRILLLLSSIRSRIPASWMLARSARRGLRYFMFENCLTLLLLF